MRFSLLSLVPLLKPVTIPAMLRKICFLLLVLISSPALAAANSTAAAEAMIAKGHDITAINLLKTTVEETPGDYQAWFLLGVTQARSRHFDDAIVSFHQVIDLQPKLAEPHNNLAVIYNERGDLRAAINELEASLTLNPGYVTAHENIGDLYVKLAAESYKKALAGNKNPVLSQRYEKLLQIRNSDKQQIRTSQAQPAVVAAASTVAVTPSVEISRKQEVLAAIEAWRSAWSRQDIDSYFAFYDETFKPAAEFNSRWEWEHYKRGVITNKKFITVELENIVVSGQKNGQVKVVMMQHFRSNSHQSDDLKQILLRKTNTGWKIIDETAL
ncbi:MAG: hypothetical protein CO187_08385 [Zetaproteobacteria bacterium CG_4_9_14_3_um_filter_53_7]|nr:MAG: hypothetical protein CO187_08385 [Zetaproteobacteria bacterium CG_4_9_14_3_um_filter_53_7]